jgi:hypothetical protein
MLNRRFSSVSVTKPYKVSVGCKDFIWGLNALGSLLKYERDQWIPFSIESEMHFRDIEALGDPKIIFAVSADGKLYQINPNTNQMHIIKVKNEIPLQCIRATSKTTLYGLDTDGLIHFLDTDESLEWKNFGPSERFRSISVGKKRRFRKPAEIWAVTMDDRPHRWDRQTKTWVTVPDRLLMVSVAQDNTVYGIRKYDSRLVKWDESYYWVPQDKLISKPILDVSAFKDGHGIMVVEREAPGARLSSSFTRKSLDALL